ncbi:MAG: hypothetical protein WBD71_02820 [Xanthobacteraceae bacterium]
MRKYSALGAYLKHQPGERVPMTFADVERVIGTKLPASAHKYRPWWSNNPDNSVMTKVWLDAGFESEQVDMQTRKLVFRRVRKPRSGTVQPSGEKPFHPLYGVMKGLVRVMSGTDLSQPADPEWAARLDALYAPEKREA